MIMSEEQAVYRAHLHPVMDEILRTWRQPRDPELAAVAAQVIEEQDRIVAEGGEVRLTQENWHREILPLLDPVLEARELLRGRTAKATHTYLSRHTVACPACGAVNYSLDDSEWEPCWQCGQGNLWEGDVREDSLDVYLDRARGEVIVR